MNVLLLCVQLHQILCLSAAHSELYKLFWRTISKPPPSPSPTHPHLPLVPHLLQRSGKHCTEFPPAADGWCDMCEARFLPSAFLVQEASKLGPRCRLLLPACLITFGGGCRPRRLDLSPAAGSGSQIHMVQHVGLPGTVATPLSPLIPA